MADFKNKQQGFTLLEIMLVVLIMAMVSVGVVMNLPKITQQDEDLNWQTQRFVTLLHFFQDEALMSGKELGIILRDNGYQFIVYQYTDKEWQKLTIKRVTTQVTLPESLTLKFTLQGAVWEELDSADVEVNKDALIPQVYVMSSGEVTPFSIEFLNGSFVDKKNPGLITINMSGEIEYEDAHKAE
ncbi:type II secretion system minor pseudopilin GspH [Psychromonas sp. CD1]|uniref:type II secretion system minor pseudopilin GspH n=1 Tax=Psychromonas sp. CD1 TaxID=1979839 RepID=UPI000B9BBE8F|nr:type II secretion system minor pseudopilin GspH [Psychromonas sp. CD1]